jgi:sarcosine oxidase subunit beta
MSETADVVIIGGGITGASAAFQLASRGVRVILCEKNFLGAGSTGRSSAIIRQHYSNEITARMALYSLRVFQNFADVVGGDAGFVQTGFVIFVEAKDRAGLEENVAMQQHVGVNTRLMSANELRELDAHLVVPDKLAAAYEFEGGYADPASTTTSFANAAKARGAQIWQDARVTNVVVAHERVVGVETTRGFISTNTVVNCANAWAPQIGAWVNLDLPIRAERHQVATFGRPASSDRPRFVVADFAASLYYRPEGGQLTLAGSIDPAHGTLVNPDNFNQGADLEFIADCAERIQRRYPAMATAEARGGWSGIYGVTPDWHPIIDAAPHVAGFFVAAGFSGHGFKLGPAVGVMIADMVMNVSTPTAQLERTLFRYQRFAEGKPVQGKYEYSIAG